MLYDLGSLPYRKIAISPMKGFQRHRCELVMIGHSREKGPVRYHWDNRKRERFSLFQYTLSGRGWFRDKAVGAPTALPPGTAFLLNSPSNTEYWLAPGDRWEFMYALFVGDMARYHCENLIRAWGPIYRLPPTSKPLEILFETYIAVAAGNIPDKFSASASLYQFLMELQRYQHAPGEEIPAEILRARQLAERQYHDRQLGLEQLAAVAGYSKYHFSRLFKQHLGLSPYAYLIRYRLKKALEIIAATTRPMKQIALAVGFNDYPYFCKMFKKYFNRTPASIRRQKKHFDIHKVYVTE